MRPPLIQGGTRTPQRGHQNKVYVMRYAWLVLSPVLSTARRRTLRNSENLLRVLSTTSGGYNSLCFPASQSYVKVVTKHSHTEVGISTSSQRLREKTYEGDDYRKGNEGLGSRGDAEQRAGYGNGELQRRAGKSRHHAGRRWTKAIVAGQTGPVLGKQTDGNRRTVRRDQGTRCRLLDLAGAVHGRGRRVLKRCPNPMPGESDVEIRPVYELTDFGENFTPEAREKEERLREQIAKRKVS